MPWSFWNGWGPNPSEENKKAMKSSEDIFMFFFFAIFIVIPISYGLYFEFFGKGDIPNKTIEDEISDRFTGLTFHGVDCLDDCSGHDAGYKWAEENGIFNEGDCDGKSDSFIEGCKIFVEEN